MAQLVQLALDAAEAPTVVLPCQLEDEIVDLAAGSGPVPAWTPPIRGPFAADQLSVPAQQRLRAGQQRSPVPPRQHSTDRGHHKTIKGLPSRPANLALKHLQLVAQSHDFQPQAGLGAAANEQ